MRTLEDLCSIIATWNETHPNRKDQPTLYFVVDKILQNIVDALEFDVFEENDKEFKFKCVNFPLVGELNLKKKNDNLFLLLDLNPYSLVINGEERSKEYTITAFKDDYRHRVAEFVFIRYEELRIILRGMYKEYLDVRLENYAQRNVDMKFILDFNKLYQRVESFFSHIESHINSVLSLNYYSNPIYGLQCFRTPKTVIRSDYKYEVEDTVKMEFFTECLPISIFMKKNTLYFDNVFEYIKENETDYYITSPSNELKSNNDFWFNHRVYLRRSPKAMILNDSTFKELFLNQNFPNISFLSFSVVITNEISDNRIIFLNTDEPHNPISIDKECRTFLVKTKLGGIIVLEIVE